MEAVAKVRIVVLRTGVRFALMSRKRAEGKPKHGQLELLGGHLDASESPIEALVRELGEEEQTGALARIAAVRKPSFETLTVDQAPHHLFELTITEQEYTPLEADPRESLGFELFPETDLASGRMEDRLTYRTREILRAFGAIGGQRSGIDRS